MTQQEKLASGLTRIEILVANLGYLGTHGIPSAKALPHVEPLRLTTEGEGVRVAAPGESITQLGHLEGWGRGPYGGVNIFLPWTRGNVNEKTVTLVAEGTGTLRVKVGSCRVGFQTVVVEIAG